MGGGDALDDLHLAEPGWEWDSVLKSSEVVGEEARFLLADRMEMSEHVHQDLELQTNHREDYAKFYDHGEGPY